MAEENFRDDEISELFSYALPPAKKVSVKQQPERTPGKARTNSRLLQRNQKCQKKVEQMRSMLKAKQMEECTFKPVINTNLQVRPRYSQTKQPFEQWQELDDMTNRPSFHPKINEKSANMTRQGPICQTLYEDAVRRKRQRDMPTPDDDKISTVSRKNNKIAGDRLVKEYAKILGEMQIDGTQPLTINQMYEIMKGMQFVRTDKAFDPHPENSLVYEAFDILTVRGEHGVRVKNLAIFLLALMGIFQTEDGNTTTSTLRDRDINLTSMQFLNSSKFNGLVDQKGELHLSKEPGMHLHKYFRTLYLNRLSRSANTSVTPSKSPNRSYNSTNHRRVRTQSNIINTLHQQTAIHPTCALGGGGIYQWMTAEESSDEEQEKGIRQFQPSCFLEGGSKLLQSRDMKTFYTHANDNESGSMLLEDSNVYQMTEPQNKRNRCGFGSECVSQPLQPIFIMEVKIQDGLIDLPVYEHQRQSPGSLIDAFAIQHNLDSQSRSKLYQTLCDTLQLFGAD